MTCAILLNSLIESLIARINCLSIQSGVVPHHHTHLQNTETGRMLERTAL